MLLKEVIKEFGEMRFMVESLNLLTSSGKRWLLSQSMMTEVEDIEKALQDQSLFHRAFCLRGNESIFSLLSVKMMQLLDISGTIRHLNHGNILTDIELFEVKKFALLSHDIVHIITPLNFSFLTFSPLVKVIDLLDPEGKRIPHFYICDQYSPTLRDLREQMSLLINNNGDEAKIEELRFRAQQVEDEIRKDISQSLSVYASNLLQNLEQLAYLDVLLARSIQIEALNLSCPICNTTITSYQGLFAPEVRQQLEEQGKHFQPIDITLKQEPTLIMGANMAGKSILLKSVALAQILFQFGFFVPAEQAQIVPVKKIALLIGDAEDTQRGLSSYAAEMLRLNEVIKDTKANVKQLVLIDELARTTNPQEGSAIVCGVVDFLEEYSVCSLVTSHYAVDIPCRKLRVKGFKQKENQAINLDNLNDYIDYSLEEAGDGQVPHEAIRIAEIIGVEPSVLNRIHRYLNNDTAQ